MNEVKKKCFSYVSFGIKFSSPSCSGRGPQWLQPAVCVLQHFSRPGQSCMPEPSIQHVDTFHFSISLLLSHIRSLLEDKSFPLNHPLGIMLNNLNHLFQEYVVIICGNKDSKMLSTALPGWVWAILVRWHWGKSFYSPLFRCGWHGWWFRSFRIKVFQVHISIRWCYCIRNLNLPKEIFS